MQTSKKFGINPAVTDDTFGSFNEKDTKHFESILCSLLPAGNENFIRNIQKLYYDLSKHFNSPTAVISSSHFLFFLFKNNVMRISSSPALSFAISPLEEIHFAGCKSRVERKIIPRPLGKQI